jgi:hypothetical protein
MFTKMFWRGLVLSASSLCLFSQPGIAQVTVTTVPRDIDSSNQAGWWRPLVVRGTDTYFAFNAPGTVANNHYVKFGKWDGGTHWTFGFLRNADGTPWIDPNQPDDIGHTQPTMAIDGDGTIHVWADGHDEPWQYFRSTSPLDVTDIRRASGMPGSVSFTYPVAATAPNGDIYLMIRNQLNGMRGRGELYRWNDSTNAWTFIAQFASHTTGVVYPDGMHIDNAGAVHLVFSWAYDHARGLRHFGSYLRYDPLDQSWRNVFNTVVTLPVNLSTPNLFYQGLASGESFTSADSGVGLQSAQVAVDNLRRPSILYRHRPTVGTGDLDFNVYRIRWNGSNWVDKVTVHTAANDSPAALGHTHNGTRVRAYFTTTSGGVMMAENTSGWVPQALDSTKAVRRISVVPRTSTTDVVYGSAPTEIDANTGRLYLFEVP